MVYDKMHVYLYSADSMTSAGDARSRESPSSQSAVERRSKVCYAHNDYYLIISMSLSMPIETPTEHHAFINIPNEL
jgi:hypothetical protein